MKRRDFIKVTGLGKKCEKGAIAAGDQVAGGRRPRCRETIVVEKTAAAMGGRPGCTIGLGPLLKWHAATGHNRDAGD